MTDLEYPLCALCGSASSASIYRGGRLEPYGISRCLSCGLYYLSPRQREDILLSVYTEDGYFAGACHGYSDYAAQEAALRATFQRLLQTMARQGRTGGALLEVGCGYGYLLAEARPYFSRRVGTDYSAGALRIAAPRADEVFQGGPEAVPREEFDCVIATHVIEHVYRPRDFVMTLLQRLRPGGTLVVATPDMGSFWRKVMGAHWPSFKLPEHVLYFDRATLTSLLVASGVGEIARLPYPHAFPLPLIASKLGLRVPTALGRYRVWLPRTTLALVGINKNA